ncbi:hypothetical protein BKM15_25850 [Pseudomonas syringae pv. syringae]|nr:hypothetical protein BKM15_25850 [Pseudomonas syringae pv. syringae]
MGKIASKKTETSGHLFDSKSEAEYFLYLKQQPDIKHIEIQPKYVLLEPFKVRCNKCKGEGKTPSPATGKPIKCRTCEGTGKRGRQAWTYTADFKVIYLDGYEEIIDVKGHANERFPLVKKMWERKYGQELVVVKKTKTGWKRG